MRSPSMPTSLSIAPVEPEPVKIDERVVVAAHGVADDAARVLAQPGGLRPVPLDSVCVLA